MSQAEQLEALAFEPKYTPIVKYYHKHSELCSISEYERAKSPELFAAPTRYTVADLANSIQFNFRGTYERLSYIPSDEYCGEDYN